MDINETATDVQSAQDITSRIESKLYPSEDPEANPITDDEVVSEDEEILPEDDDTEADEDEGLDDLEVEEEESEQSLASYLGVDEDRISVGEDGTVSLKAIIDGEEKDVPLSELAKSYQLQGHVNNKSIALENQRKELEEQKQQVAAELEKRVATVLSLTEAAEEQLVGDFNNIDWDRLRTENPSEWSALRQEYAEKAAHIQQMQSAASQEKQRITSENQAKFQAQRQAALSAEYEKMLIANPGWADETTRKTELDGMRGFLTDTYGFGEDDMQYVTDHRLVSLIQDAKKYRSGAKAAETKIAKVVPKFQKPGSQSKNSANLSKARAVKAKRAAMRNSNGHISDVASFIEDRM